MSAISMQAWTQIYLSLEMETPKVSGQSSPLLNNTHGEELFLLIYLQFFLLQLLCVISCPFDVNFWQKFSFIFFINTF